MLITTHTKKTIDTFLEPIRNFNEVAKYKINIYKLNCQGEDKP